MWNCCHKYLWYLFAAACLVNYLFSVYILLYDLYLISQLPLLLPGTLLGSGNRWAAARRTPEEAQLRAHTHRIRADALRDTDGRYQSQVSTIVTTTQTDNKPQKTIEHNLRKLRNFSFFFFLYYLFLNHKQKVSIAQGNGERRYTTTCQEGCPCDDLGVH